MERQELKHALDTVSADLRQLKHLQQEQVRTLAPVISESDLAILEEANRSTHDNCVIEVAGEYNSDKAIGGVIQQGYAVGDSPEPKEMVFRDSAENNDLPAPKESTQKPPVLTSPVVAEVNMSPIPSGWEKVTSGMTAHGDRYWNEIANEWCCIRGSKKQATMPIQDYTCIIRIVTPSNYRRIQRQSIRVAIGDMVGTCEEPEATVITQESQLAGKPVKAFLFVFRPSALPSAKKTVQLPDNHTRLKHRAYIKPNDLLRKEDGSWNPVTSDMVGERVGKKIIARSNEPAPLAKTNLPPRRNWASDGMAKPNSKGIAKGSTPYTPKVGETPAGYRVLGAAEIVKEGDMTWIPTTGWESVTKWGFGKKASKFRLAVIREEAQPSLLEGYSLVTQGKIKGGRLRSETSCGTLHPRLGKSQKRT